MSSATAQASSKAMEKSEGSRVRSRERTGKRGSESPASMLALKLEYVPTRYAMEESAGRFLISCGVWSPAPEQQPQSCSSGITHWDCGLICHHPSGAQRCRDSGDWDHCRSAESRAVPW